MSRIKHRKIITAAIGIVFDSQGRVLLNQRHQPGFSHHGKWHFPGGGIEYGEHPPDAVIREVKEETGIDIEIISSVPFIHSQIFTDTRIHIILLAYTARATGGKIDFSNDEETNDARWFEIENIDYSVCLPEVETLIHKAKILVTNI